MGTAECHNSVTLTDYVVVCLADNICEWEPALPLTRTLFLYVGGLGPNSNGVYSYNRRASAARQPPPPRQQTPAKLAAALDV